MNRRNLSGLVLLAATVIAAAGSHLVYSWLKMAGGDIVPYVIGKSSGKPPAFLGASSIGNYGIAWDQIAGAMGTEIRGWGMVGGTPIEFEQFQKKFPEARTTFIVISTYDMDEARSCDVRAEVVPLIQAIASLRADQADWQEAKTVLGQYPVAWLRVLFPTLGRSKGIMGTALMKVHGLLQHSSRQLETLAGPVLDFGKRPAHDEYASQKLSDWSRSKVISKLVGMRVEFHGAHSFAGAKKRALERMLQYANQRGGSVVLVMPISTAYNGEFVSAELARQFETALAEVHRHAPQTEFLRLDQLPGATSDENFCDLVHMNVPGQKLATEALTAWVKRSYVAHQP